MDVRIDWKQWKNELIQGIPSLIRSPKAFFAGRKTIVFLDAVLMFVAVGVIAGLLLFATAWIRADDLATAQTGPWTKATFPLIWAFLIAVAAVFRFYATNALEDHHVSLSSVTGLSIYTALPAMLMGAVIGLVQNFYVLTPLDGTAYAIWQLIVIVAVILALWLDARIYVAGAMQHLKQNRGRSVLGWMVPLAGWAALYALFYLGVLLYSFTY